MLRRIIPLVLLATSCRTVSTATEVRELQYAVANELAGELHSLYGDRPGLRVVADERTNSLVLTGTASDVHEATRVIDVLDKPAGGVAKR